MNWSVFSCYFHICFHRARLIDAKVALGTLVLMLSILVIAYIALHTLFSAHLLMFYACSDPWNG